MSRFRGKKVLITGGTSGIGFAAARRFQAEGAAIAIIGANAERLTEAKAALPGAIAIQADASDVSATTEAVDQAARRLGGLQFRRMQGAHRMQTLKARDQLFDWPSRQFLSRPPDEAVRCRQLDRRRVACPSVWVNPCQLGLPHRDQFAVDLRRLRSRFALTIGMEAEADDRTRFNRGGTLWPPPLKPPPFAPLIHAHRMHHVARFVARFVAQNP